MPTTNAAVPAAGLMIELKSFRQAGEGLARNLHVNRAN